MVMAPKHFVHFTDKELVQKAKDLQNSNTLKNQIKATRLLQEYLCETGSSDDFLNFTEQELD